MRLLAASLAAAGAAAAAGARLPGDRTRLITIVPQELVAGGGAALATFVVAIGITAHPTAAAMVAALVAGTVVGVARRRRRAISAEVAERWPDVLAAVRSLLAAGDAVPEALVIACERSTPVMVAIGDEIATRRSQGETFDQACAALRSRLADPTTDRVLVTLAAAARAGGTRVGAILSGLSASVADELRLRKAHEAALTQQRLTAAVALFAPWILLAFTLATNPAAGDAYRSPTGHRVIVVGGVGTLAGHLLARRAAALAAPPRVFS